MVRVRVRKGKGGVRGGGIKLGTERGEGREERRREGAGGEGERE